MYVLVLLFAFAACDIEIYFLASSIFPSISVYLILIYLFIFYLVRQYCHKKLKSEKCLTKVCLVVLPNVASFV